MRRGVLSAIAAAMLIVQHGVYAESADVAVKKFDPYAMIKVYYGYHKLSPESSESELDLNYGLQLDSRAGAKIDIENVKTQFEFGLDSSANNVSLRLAFGVINFGDLAVMIGKNYTPYYVSSVGDYVEDNNMSGFGASYDGRQVQIRVDIYGFYADFITPGRNTGDITGTGSTGLVKDTSVLFPKTAIGYDFTSDKVFAGLGGAINVVKINDPGCAVDGENIVSWIGYAHTNVVLGNFIVKANMAYGQNTGNFGIYSVTNSDRMAITYASTAVPAGGKLKNTKTVEGFINPQYKVSSVLLLSCGAGYAQAENPTYAEADSQFSYFVDLKYDIDKYFSIMPSFSYRNYMKDKNGNKQGSEYYAGVQLMLSI